MAVAQISGVCPPPPRRLEPRLSGLSDHDRRHGVPTKMPYFNNPTWRSAWSRLVPALVLHQATQGHGELFLILQMCRFLTATQTHTDSWSGCSVSARLRA